MLSEHERDQAIKEGARNAADAAYFNERPHLADDTGIRVFDAGFDRGWDAATAPLLARIAELEAANEAFGKRQEWWNSHMLELEQQLAEARKDAERYRWLRDKNSHNGGSSAWISSVTTVKDGPCDIFSADEVPALLDAEIDRRMTAIRAAIKEQT